ncbi:hypothetical protein PV10_02929 [Exophiala mesophila]|uniref:Histone transcription regulator 3 homolog n=1 Tax=Exophiala mesophila TaxID=212818 RepID=A0A0D1Y3M2_EXOME|nr:uncharacterized protein PV10_02929 [Exophiala mesophila]KIV95256.1 hypothetical protein PV10_02929 [Exophiala mesophila]
MSGFTALNVEPEDSFEEEIDDTKEIQLEEAFKLYQNALKLHSQGPAFFNEARDAYRELLQSEVFKYPEAVSEYTHDENDDDAVTGITQPDSTLFSLIPTNAADSSASSIPQILYLAFKNKGQFALDVARHHLPDKHADRAALCQYYMKACLESIHDFAKALERDDADLDLWKKGARIADVLSSQRISRFCIESVLAGDDEGDSGQAIDLSGLDEAFAAGELQQLLKLLQDDLSRVQNTDVRPRAPLLLALRSTNDPYPFLPSRPDHLDYSDDRYKPSTFDLDMVKLEPAEDTFPSLGEEITKAVHALQDVALAAASAAPVHIEISDKGEIRSATDMIAENAAPASPTKAEPSLKLTESPMTTPSAGIQLEVEVATTSQPTLSDRGDKATDKATDPDTDMVSDHDTLAVITTSEPSDVHPVDGPEEHTAQSVSRKRSTTAAGNEEPEGRTKSKRLRARESMADLAAQEEVALQDDPQFFLDQLAVYENADQATFDVVNSLLSKFEMRIFLSAEEAKQAFWQDKDLGAVPDTGSKDADLKLSSDLRMALLNWSDDKSHAIINGHGNQDFTEKSTGMSLFLQHSRSTSTRGTNPPAGSNESAFSHLVSQINSTPTNLFDVAILWLYSLLASDKHANASQSSYMRETWPEELKAMVTQVARSADEQVYQRLLQHHTLLGQRSDDISPATTEQICSLFELVQSLYELHLEHFAQITGPSSETEDEIRSMENQRLNRWAGLAELAMSLYLDTMNQPRLDDPLIIRYTWASTTQATLEPDIDKTHVLMCLQDLRALVEQTKAPALYLPNNTAMPVIDTTAIDQEVSRLSTLDFFTSVFDTDNSDPAAVIEKLEPILEYGFDTVAVDSPSQDLGDVALKMKELNNFLEAGDASLKLFLWRRLQNAYTAISYTPKVVSCLLRSLEISVNELYTSRHFGTDDDARRLDLLRWLRDIDELVIRLVPKVLSEDAPFECVDEQHLRTSTQAVVRLIRLLHGFIIYEDSVRVGQTSPPSLKGASSVKLYDKSKDRFREMLVRLWTLQYTLLKEATVQDPSSFTRAPDDLAEYVSFVHNALGIRHYCKYANKTFVKLVKSELGALETQQDYSADMIQVFFDLYQLRFTSGVGDVNHGCPTETLDRKTAWSLIPTIMSYVSNTNIKDLAKSELKGTIDKIQQAMGVLKNQPSLSYNRRTISSYLKTPINPNDLYQCIRGIGDLPTRPVVTETDVAARSGWYSLLGQISLAKYKSVKRVTPTPTDDLDLAASLFRQELDHNIYKWETWYRLAQVYEAKIEDDLIWNSTKLNDARADIALLERQAIHCFMMATAIAMRSSDDSTETAQKVEDMLSEFGTRLYASSRPPLDMEAFRTDKYTRHLSSTVDGRMSKQPIYQPVDAYSLWKFAAFLLGRKLTHKPKPWLSHYTRGKCLWKMFQQPVNASRKRPVTAEHVLEAFTDAIESLPKKEKSSEPILEPHFKLASVLHKMVSRRVLSPHQGWDYMQHTRYAQGITLEEDDDGPEWIPYILAVLKKLQNADKANWHHRFINRAAHAIYDVDRTLADALGAKHQFTQQIFTKTMTLQVWKPEYERPGRHYVYTGRYVDFFVQILVQLNDRANLDQLIRRIRRKTTDFLNHTKVWEDTVVAYVGLLRKHGKIPDGRERAVFDGMNHEEFTKKSEKVEQWALDPETSSVYLDIMRDAIDLKRLNNSLMKGPAIDDLIGDSYTCLYEEFIRQLPEEEQPAPQPMAYPQGTFINMMTESNTGDDGALNRSQADGVTEGPLAVSVSAPLGLGVQGTPTMTTGHVVPDVHRVPGKPGRTKTVTRREIQRKAEAAIAKPPPIKTPILSKRPTIEIVIKSDRGDSPLDKRVSSAKGEDADHSRASSRRSSMVDGGDKSVVADDDSDSELSEPDDDTKQLFSELEQAGEHGDDAGEEDGEGQDGGEDESGEDRDDDDHDEEMADAEGDGDGDGEGEGEEEMEGEGELEIPETQDVGNAPEKENSSDGEENDEFHEAVEQNEG